ncbi:MAG: hypothetical protein KBD25_02705 [Rickettsiaceae bacterium]|nr:hypothetical protein [Rickettsiaceae bacterium]
MLKKYLLTALVVSCSNLLATEVVEDVVTGQEFAYFTDLSAYKLNGSRDTNLDHTNTCLNQFGWILNTKLLEINYKIAVRTGMQSATVSLLNASAALSPMGLANSYSFLTQNNIPDILKNYNIRQIYFRLDRGSFKLRKAAVSFSDNSLDFQCIAEVNY